MAFLWSYIPASLVLYHILKFTQDYNKLHDFCFQIGKDTEKKERRKKQNREAAKTYRNKQKAKKEQVESVSGRLCVTGWYFKILFTHIKFVDISSFQMIYRHAFPFPSWDTPFGAVSYFDFTVFRLSFQSHRKNRPLAQWIHLFVVYCSRSLLAKYFVVIQY